MYSWPSTSVMWDAGAVGDERGIGLPAELDGARAAAGAAGDDLAGFAEQLGRSGRRSAGTRSRSPWTPHDGGGSYASTTWYALYDATLSRPSVGAQGGQHDGDARRDHRAAGGGRQADRRSAAVRGGGARGACRRCALRVVCGTRDQRQRRRLRQVPGHHPGRRAGGPRHAERRDALRRAARLPRLPRDRHQPERRDTRRGRLSRRRARRASPLRLAGSASWPTAAAS